MSRDEAPPFARGETYYNGSTKDPIFTDPINLLGKEYVFEPNSPDSQNLGDPAGRPIRVKVVQNGSGVNLKPARLAHFNAADPYETAVDGYCYQLSDRPAGVIDEFLPAAGVTNGDIFYIVIDGPSSVTQLSSGPSTLAIGSAIVPGASTSRTNDDSGRVALQDLTGATATLGNNIQNRVGFAGAADSTANDVVKAVVHLGRR